MRCHVEAPERVTGDPWITVLCQLSDEVIGTEATKTSRYRLGRGGASTGEQRFTSSPTHTTAHRLRALGAKRHPTRDAFAANRERDPRWSSGDILDIESQGLAKL